MSAWNSYSFSRPLYKSGKPTRYLSVLSLLDKQGPTSKREILDKVWCVIDPYNPNLWRGHMSTTFAAMRRKGVVVYNSKTRKWSITDLGKSVIESADRKLVQMLFRRLLAFNCLHSQVNEL